MKTLNLSKFLVVLSVCIILLFLMLNIYTPLIAEDYYYSIGIYSLSDIIRAQYNLYFYWEGRIVALSLTQFWLFVGKPFYNIANTLVYCAFILLVQFHITGNLKKPNPGLFLILNIFFWFFSPTWGQVFLWISGSCVYLWTAFIVLLFLVPFRKKRDNPEYKFNMPFSILFFLAGIIAGWSMENTAAAALFLLIAYFITKIVKKDRFALFEILGAIGFLIGFSLLIAAPGKNVRLVQLWEATGEGYLDYPVPVMYIKRFVNITGIFINNNGFLFMSISAILGFDLVYNQKRKLNTFSYFYGLAALTAAYSMLLSPIFPERAFLIVLVFSVITLGNVLLQMELRMPDIIKRNAAVILFVVVLIPTAYSFFNAGKEIVGIYLRWYDRVEYILAEKEKGNLSIEVRPIASNDKHSALYAQNDLVNKDVWPNTDMADYFGLKSIDNNDEGLLESVLGSILSEKEKRIRQLFTAPWGIIKRIREI